MEPENQSEKRKRWLDFDRSLEPMREAFRADYGHLTNDEVMQLIDDIIHDRDTDWADKS